jgi:hypothetical protein
MSDTLFVRPYVISSNAAGLCNQLFFLINSILYCSQKNINKMIVSDFVSDNTLLTKINTMDLINIEKTNEFLKKYNVMIIDYTTSNTEHNFSEDFHKLDLYTSLNSSWINLSNFFDIFNNITFQDQFYRISNNLIPEIKLKLGEDIKINVVHLRLEPDALIHWSNMNNMNPINFKKIIEKKYIYLINKFINKNVFTIIMSYSTDNNVIKFLNINKYNYFIKKKDPSIGRECNALNDLLLARQMNNFFIGSGGSTFTDCIMSSTNKKKAIIIDLNNILNPEDIRDF